MRFGNIILIFGSIFLAAKLVDVIVSSFDVFNWIGYLQNTCKFFNQTDSTTSSNGPYVWLFFVLSVLLTFIFTIVVFCSYRLKTKEETKDDSYILKLLLEIFIIFAFFDPVSNVKLLLRDCLAGYLMVGAVLISYILASNIASVAIEIKLKQRYYQNNNYRLVIVIFCLAMIFQSIQISACLTTFGIFFGFVLNMDDIFVKYGYLVITVVFCASVGLKNVINRWTFYDIISNNKRYNNKCYLHCITKFESGFLRLCFDAVITAVNFLTCLLLFGLTTVYIQNNTHNTLYIVTLVFLGLSSVVSMSYYLFNFSCYFCSSRLSGSHYIEHKEKLLQTIDIDHLTDENEA